MPAVVREVLKTWFSLSRPVGQRFYAATGFGLVAFKYAVDSMLIWVATGTAWTPLGYLNPSLGARETAAGAPLAEWSPYQHVYAPHLVGGLETERGEFRLIPLAADRTRLEGSTWYRNNLFPQLYWNLWSDALIHRIHRRVLDHVKRRSEGRGAGPSSPDRAP
jgi:hypothetical protein